MSLPPKPNTSSDPHAVRYRAMCPAAVLSVAVGVLAIPVLVFWFSWFWAVIPLAGIGLGWQAQRQIRKAPDEWTGLIVTQIGIGLSIAIWVIGYGWLFFARTSEVPYGYTWVNYDALQPDPNSPADPIPQTALDMQDKRVFVKGFMQAGRRQTGIKEFILCPRNADCQFCNPNPQRTEMIRVVLQGDMETIYTTHLIGVGGRFQVDPQDPSGIPYAIEADYLH